MTRLTAHRVAAAAVVLALSCWSQAAAASLQEALDRPVELSIPDATIAEVFSRLSEKTGIRFLLTEETLAWLPYGAQTRLRVELKNVTVRDGLSRMLTQQALRWEVADEAVRIVPSEALYRMCRRASYEELQLLGGIHSARLTTTGKGAKEVLEHLRAATGSKKLKFLFHVPADRLAAFQRANRVLPGTVAAWLDTLCHGTGWTWYVWGDDIVILDRKDQVRRQLKRQVSLRYQHAKLLDVLRDLAGKGHVQMTLEPGVMNYLPPDVRTNFELMADATIAQALEFISGGTGLKFTPTAEGVHVSASEALKQGTVPAAARKRSPFFVRVSLPGPPGANIEVFFRADDLPEEVIRAIEAQKEQFVKDLIERYGSAGKQKD